MLRDDCLKDIEMIIHNLIITKGYSENDILDAMYQYLIQKKTYKQEELLQIKRKSKKMIEIPEEAINLSKLFSELCSKRRKPIKPFNISFGAKELMKLYDITKSWDNIEWAIRYSQDPKNAEDPYFPVIYSYQALREKYYKLLDHEKRNQKQIGLLNITPEEKVKNVRKVIYYNGKSFNIYEEYKSKCPFKPNLDLDLFVKMNPKNIKNYFNLKTKKEEYEENKRITDIIKNLKNNLEMSQAFPDPCS